MWYGLIGAAVDAMQMCDSVASYSCYYVSDVCIRQEDKSNSFFSYGKFKIWKSI